MAANVSNDLISKGLGTVLIRGGQAKTFCSWHGLARLLLVLAFALFGSQLVWLFLAFAFFCTNPFGFFLAFAYFGSNPFGFFWLLPFFARKFEKSFCLAWHGSAWHALARQKEPKVGMRFRDWDLGIGI